MGGFVDGRWDGMWKYDGIGAWRQLRGELGWEGELSRPRDEGPRLIEQVDVDLAWEPSVCLP